VDKAINHSFNSYKFNQFKKTSSNGSGSPWRGVFNYPFPFPSGEAIRRHEARGWLTLR